MFSVTGGTTELVICQEWCVKLFGILTGGETILLVEVSAAATDHADAVFGIIAGRNVPHRGRWS